jgi:hypothetical protein
MTKAERELMRQHVNITSDMSEAEQVKVIADFIRKLMEPEEADAPPPLGINVVETISAEEKLGGH